MHKQVHHVVALFFLIASCDGENTASDNPSLEGQHASADSELSDKKENSGDNNTIQTLMDANNPVLNSPIAAVLSDPPPNSNDRTEFVPQHNNAAFRNPGKGWVVYDFTPTSGGSIAHNTPLASLVYSNYFSWGDLEPTEGGYDFSPIDNFINKIKPGQKIGIAIVVLDPTSRPNLGARGYGQVPGWLIQKMGSAGGDWINTVYNRAVRKEGGENGYVFAPHYYNWYFLDAHKKLLQALATRYGATNPTQKNWRGILEFIEISTFGAWGEWHQTEYYWPSVTLQQQTLVQMVDDYFNAFAAYPEIKFEISGAVDRVNPGYGVDPANAVGPAYDLTAIYYAISRGARITRKFVGAKESSYLSARESQLLIDKAKSNALRLEWGSWDGLLFDFYDPIDSTYRGYIHTAVQRALEFQTSYLGWHVNSEVIHCGSGATDYNNCSYCGEAYKNTDSCKLHPFPGRAQRTFDPLSLLASTGDTLRDHAQKQSGYRFELTKVEYPRRRAKSQNLDVTFNMNQVAVAKLYDSYKLRFWLARPNEPELDLGSVDFTANAWPVGVNMNKVLNLQGLKVPNNATTGWYKVKFAVVDVTGKPAMNFAIKGKDIADENIYGKYFIGDIYID